MKSIQVIIFLAFLSINALGQSTETAKGDSIPWEFRKQAFIYNTAKQFNDPLVEKMALYNLLSENPSNAALYDSLSLIYLNFNQFASAALVAKQALKINKDNMLATEVAASSLERLGVKDQALTYYEKLSLSSPDNIGLLYKIAYLQYELKRFEQAKTSLKILEEKKGIENEKLTFPTTDRKGQFVPLKAAIMRVKAMIAEGEGKKEEANKLYMETLKLSPGFQVVQQQLKELNKK